MSSLGYIQVGSKGQAVVDLQTLLLKAGYSLPKYGVDGIFGAETQKAVMELQSSTGATVDGVVGAETLYMLKFKLGLVSGNEVPSTGPVDVGEIQTLVLDPVKVKGGGFGGTGAGVALGLTALAGGFWWWKTR
jgi:peptidoglycan hydrolase-like protein with peptidoglycan-binding domain